MPLTRTEMPLVKKLSLADPNERLMQESSSEEEDSACPWDEGHSEDFESDFRKLAMERGERGRVCFREKYASVRPPLTVIL